MKRKLTSAHCPERRARAGRGQVGRGEAKQGEARQVGTRQGEDCFDCGQYTDDPQLVFNPAPRELDVPWSVYVCIPCYRNRLRLSCPEGCGEFTAEDLRD